MEALAERKEFPGSGGKPKERLHTYHFATDAAALLCLAIEAGSKSGSLISFASCRPTPGPSDAGSTAFILSSATLWFLSMALVAAHPLFPLCRVVPLPSRTTHSVLSTAATVLGGRSSPDSSIRSALLGSRNGVATLAGATTGLASAFARVEPGVPSPSRAGRSSVAPLRFVALTHPFALRTLSAPSLETRCSSPITNSPGTIEPTFRVLTSIPERTASFLVAINLAPRASSEPRTPSSASKLDPLAPSTPSSCVSRDRSLYQLGV